MDQLKNYYKEMGVDEKVFDYAQEVEKGLKDRFETLDAIAQLNQIKVLNAMQKHQIAEMHLGGTTGYGYNDSGREAVEALYADVFGTEDALVRPQITCGTHALGLALSANLRPGDEILAISGKPYDTLEEVIGIRESKGSLKEYGITYAQVDLLEDGSFDLEGIKNAINDKTKLIHIQRSKGYATRPTLSVDVIGETIAFVKEINKDLIVMVDNCYGEFVEEKEPSEVGADMIVGSLIKNPGGGLAPIGGYICGRSDLIEQCAYRLTTPGLGKEVGASLGVNRQFIQGFFMAPTVVNAAVKGAIFAANLYEKLGFKVIPDAVLKGGRYDNLIEQFGKKAPSVGFAIVLDELMMALSRQGIHMEADHMDTMIIYKEATMKDAILRAEELRKEGKKVILERKNDLCSKADYERFAKEHRLGGILYFI